MTQAQWQFRWRNGARLKEIIRNWAALPSTQQTTATLELATDAAHLARTFVAEKCDESLLLRGLRKIATKPGAASDPNEANADAEE